MYKVMHFIKRKPHLTHEQFRDHFERSHAAMANSGYSQREWDWDLISEWTLPNEAALEEIYRIMQTPGIDELFHADEDRFIDRTATVTVPCDVRGGGNGFDPKGTVFDTPDGVPRWD